MSDVAKARELLELTTQRKELEKREKQLKEYFRETLGPGSFDLSGLVVQVTPRARTNLDLEGVRRFLGEVTVKQFEKTVSYTEVSVAAMKVVEVHPSALIGYAAHKKAGES